MTTSGATPEIWAMTSATGQRNGDGRHVHDEVGQDHHEEGHSQHKDQPVGLFEQRQPVDGQPFSRSGLPETEADAHRSGKEKHDVPGYQFQIVNVQDLQHKEENCGNEKDRRLVQGSAAAES